MLDLHGASDAAKHLEALAKDRACDRRARGEARYLLLLHREGTPLA